MEFYKRAYSVVRIIQNQRFGKITNNSNYFGSKNIYNPLKLLINSINIEKSALIVSQRSKIHIEQLTGDKIDLDFFAPEKIIGISSLHKRNFIFKIQGFDYLNNRFIVFGYLILVKKATFKQSEIKVIEFISSMLGEHILKRAILTFQNKYTKKATLLKNFSVKNKKPGTIILKMLHYLNKGLNSTFGYFCILNESTLKIDYAVNNKRNEKFYNLKAELDINNTPLKNSLEKTYQHIVKSKSITKLLSIETNDINQNYSYLLYSIKSDKNVIALWIFAYSDDLYFNKEKSKALIETANKIIGENFNYLFQRKTNKMIINPNFKSRETKEENKIFVLMPFTLDWSDRIWAKILKPTIENLNIPVKRADDLFGRDIVEDIWKEILTSNIIIADITNRNPNVFYELGIAHTLGKKVILLTQSVDDIPFDLNRYRHIIYQDNLDGYDILKKQVASTIETMLNE